MKNKTKKVLAMILTSSIFVGMLGSCVSSIRGEESETSVDNTKTQLYIGYYYSGLGKDWIQEAASKFEETYAKTSFESGKMGIQVRLDLDKAGLNGGDLVNTISSKRDSVFFIENSDMYQFIDKNLILDITEMVKGKASENETRTIEEKLTNNSKDYYNVGGHYYALPYYEGIMGINYNIDLFNDKCYYFAEGKNADDFDWENGDLGGLFIQNITDKKSYGPDNIEGTYDDGLPATYADFRALLLRINSYGDTPMIWCGSYLTYLIEFMNAVWADFEGYDQMSLNWSMNGTATDLINVDKNGNISYVDKNGIKITDGDKGYMLQKQEGKYRALEFAKIFTENSDNYYVDSFSSALTHIDAQRRFVKGGQGSYGNIAMLLDGNWWDVEATAQFDADKTSANSKLNKNFGFMPIPKANTEYVENNNGRTLLTLNSSMAFINANTEKSILPAAKAFLQYVHSDEVLNIFSKNCNMMRPFDYTLTDDTLSEMSAYGKEMYRLHTEAIATENGTSSYPIRIQDAYPTTSASIKNSNLLNPKTWGWSNNNGSVNPFVVFKENASMTAAEYFNSMYDFYVGSWESKWAK